MRNFSLQGPGAGGNSIRDTSDSQTSSLPITLIESSLLPFFSPTYLFSSIAQIDADL